MRGTGGTTGFASLMRNGVTALVLAALVVAVGSAQASTSTKFYAASIAPTTVSAGSSSAQLTLTLTNMAGSTQTLGSANFTAPAAWTISSPAAGGSMPVTSDEGKPWTVANAANLIQLRASSPGDALAPGHSVSATVTTSIPCTAVGTATWATQAKQSNSFNGPPGNDFARTGSDPAVTVTAGGGSFASLVFDPVGRQSAGTPFQVTVTAKDTCGFTKADYSGATLGGTLAGSPTYGAFTWSNGVGTASVTAPVSQTGAMLTASDGPINGSSNTFDVFDAICTANTLCETSNSSTDVSTVVDSNTPATMALMLSELGAQFTCNNSTHNAVGSLVTLDPQGYAGKTFLATLRYSKSAAPGTGVANFIVCLGKSGMFTQLDPCKKNGPAPCIDSRNRNGVGDLVIVLRLDTSDPVGGTYN
jgi:large repetitive protein